jgi:hypothetical protein
MEEIENEHFEGFEGTVGEFLDLTGDTDITPAIVVMKIAGLKELVLGEPDYNPYDVRIRVEQASEDGETFKLTLLDDVEEEKVDNE